MNQPQYKTGLRILTAVFFAVTGALHFITTPFYVSIVPARLPHPLALVSISGVCEILGGIGLLVPGARRVAGGGLILLLIAVFPANINMFAKSFQSQGMSLESMLLALRLPLQFVFIVLVYRVVRNRS